MRNLKRALSLALASVMLVGMMVVGTSAASYPDVDEKNNVEAIDVLNAVGVMIGDAGTGNFRPDDKVSRNEMAVIMAKLILGTYEADSYVGSHPFTDVPDWASKYVAACYNSGIIAGRGEGIYDGSSTVTAVEAAAMMLRALGYEDLSKGAAQWDQPVAAKANEVNLFDGLSGSSQTPMDRDSVAKLALNTLETTMVTTTRSGSDISIPGVEIISNVNYTLRTSGAGWSDAIDREGNPAGSGIYLQLGEQLYKGDLRKDPGDDDFGRPATKWEYKGDPIITVADDATLTYTDGVKAKTIYSDLDKGAFTYDADPEDNQFACYVDGAANNTILNLNKDTATEFGGKGTLTEVYYDRTEKTVTIVVINSYLAEVNGDYDKDDKELDISFVDCTPPSVDTTLSADDVDGLEGFADGDKVIVTIAEKSGDQYVSSIKLAEKVTGEVSTYTKDDSVTVAGTKYKYNATYDEKSNITYTIGNEYDLYLDNYGNILQADSIEAEAGEYVYISEVADPAGLTAGKNWTASAYFTDGTYKAITVSKVTDTAGSNVTSPVGSVTGWCTFTTKDDKYELTQVTQVGGDNISGDLITQNGKVPIEQNNVNIAKGTNSTIFITVDDDNNVKSYTGIKNVPSFTAADTNSDTFVVNNANGYAKYVFINLGGATKKGTSSTDLVYILKTDAPKEAKDSDKNTYYIYDAIVNGESGKTVNANSNGKTDFGGANGTVGLYTDVEYDEDGYISNAVLLTAVNTAPAASYEDDFLVSATYAGVLVSQNGDVLTVGSDTYALADGVKIYKIDNDADRTVKTVTAKALANEFGPSGTVLNGIIYAVLKDGACTALYVDLSAVLDPGDADAPIIPDGSTDPQPGDVIIGDGSTLNSNSNVPSDFAPGANLVLGFATTRSNQKGEVIIKTAAGVEVYKESGTFASAGDHIFYISLTGKNGSGSGTWKSTAAATGAYIYTITVDGVIAESGNFKVS